MMSGYLTNRLEFRSNAKFILDLIRNKAPQTERPAQISLDSIRPTPPSLLLPLTRPIKALALMNMDAAGIPAAVKEAVTANLFKGRPDKQSPEALAAAVTAARAGLSKTCKSRRTKTPAPSSESSRSVLESAVTNFEQQGFFCHLDWRWAQWGTTEDIHSVVPATFMPNTTAIEFTTRWTPPIAALEALAQMFPSVRFELAFRYRRRDTWNYLEIFPTTPFGY